MKINLTNKDRIYLQQHIQSNRRAFAPYAEILEKMDEIADKLDESPVELTILDWGEVLAFLSDFPTAKGNKIASQIAKGIDSLLEAV